MSLQDIDVPAHIESIIGEVVMGLPVHRRELATRILKHIYRGGYLDGVRDSSWEKILRDHPTLVHKETTT